MDDRKRECTCSSYEGSNTFQWVTNPNCPLHSKPDPIRAAAEEIRTQAYLFHQEPEKGPACLVLAIESILRREVERERDRILDKMDVLSADGSGWREKWYMLYVRIQKGEKHG